MARILITLNPDKSRLSITMWPGDFTSLHEMAQKLAEHLNTTVFRNEETKLEVYKRSLR